MGSATNPTRRRLALLSLLLLGLAACGSDEVDDAGSGLTVVATTTILGDVVGNVVDGGARVEVLMPVGVDPHEFQASSQEVAALQAADLVVVNGLGLEEGLADVLDAAAADGANVVEVAPLLDPTPFGPQQDEGGDDNGKDPHVWMDPIRMAEAARFIGIELATLDPDRDWRSRADTYADELIAADEEIATILDAAGGRKMVTNHDSLGYFAARYGFDIVGVVIPGGSTLGDPSSAELATLVDVIAGEGVQAIFAETTQPSALAEAIAAEVGESVEVVELYTGSLGAPGSDADSLIGMLETNAQRIAEALS